MNTQSIIVYTNPYQRDFYESGMLIPLIGGLTVFFITFLILMWVAQKVSRDWRGPNNFVTGAAAVGGICIGALAFHWLFI